MESVLKSKARRLRSSYTLKQELWTLMREMKFLYMYTFKRTVTPGASASQSKQTWKRPPDFFQVLSEIFI